MVPTSTLSSLSLELESSSYLTSSPDSTSEAPSIRARSPPHDDQTGFFTITYTSQVITRVASSLASPASMSMISSGTTKSISSSPVVQQPGSNTGIPLTTTVTVPTPISTVLSTVRLDLASPSFYRSSGREKWSLQTGHPTLTIAGLIRSGSAPWYNNTGVYSQPADMTDIVTKVLPSVYAAKKDTAVITSKFTSEWYSSGVTLVTHTDRTVRHWEALYFYNCRSSHSCISLNVLTYFRYRALLVIKFWRPWLLWWVWFWRWTQGWHGV